MLEPVVEPVIIILEADEDGRRPAVTGDDNLFSLRAIDILREIVFDFRGVSMISYRIT